MQQAEGIQPLHYLQFDNGQRIRDMLLLDEQGRAVVHSHVEAIDLWGTMVSAWPEVLGAIAALCLLVALWVVWRRAHRPRRAGVLFCRRCNYELGAVEQREHILASGEKCSECGREVTPRLLVRGRAQRWRILRPLAVGLLPVAAVGVLYLSTGMDRSAGPTRWMSLPSVRFSAWAAANKWSWLDRSRRTYDRFEEWDLQAGKLVRVIRTGPGSTWSRTTLTTDRSALIGMHTHRLGLVSIDLESGHVRSMLALPGGFRLPHGECGIVADPDDPDRVFVLILDSIAEEHALYTWNTRSGESAELYRTPAWCYQPGRPVERTLWRTTENGTPVLVTMPTFMEIYNRQEFEVSVLSFAGALVRSFTVDPPPEPSGATVVAGVPRLFAIRGRGMVGVDTATGETLGVVRHGSDLLTAKGICANQSGSLTVIPSVNGTLYVRDTVDTAWLSPLVEDTEAYAPQLSMSSEGRWVVAVSQRNVPAPAPGGKKSYANDVLVWKLPEAWFAPADAFDETP